MHRGPGLRKGLAGICLFVQVQERDRASCLAVRKLHRVRCTGATAAQAFVIVVVELPIQYASELRENLGVSVVHFI